jgi:signal transduction histidine kinase
MGRRAVAVLVASLGAAAGVYVLRLGRQSPAWSFVGTSSLAGAALLAAGWALIAVGLLVWLRRPNLRTGPLLAAAGFAWFVPELTNPAAGSAVAFTTGIALSGLCPPIVAHATLGYPTGRLGPAVDRAVVVVAYAAGLGLLGVLPASLSDPRGEGCGECRRNLVLVAHRASGADDLTRIGLALGFASALAVALLCLRRAFSSSRPARFVSIAGAAYLAFVAAEDAAFLDRGGFLEIGTLERRLWLGQASALIGLAAAVAWGIVRARRTRAEVARLVVELAQSPPPGGLRDALAAIAGDPELVLAYPLEQDGRFVDADGHAVALPPDLERTTLARGGQPVAVLAHRRGVLADAELVEEVSAAARLALENERLQAEIRARVEELRASRVRIVDTADAERRRLERDLHDGAQQRLVGLSLSLRLLASRVPAAQLDRADEELRLAIAELRELAHGIFPAVLGDEGLAAAVEALAEEARVPLRIGALAEGRFAPAVETAAYTIVSEVVRTAASPVDVRTERRGTALAVELRAPALDGIDIVGLEDRIGALDGTLTVARAADGHVHVHAELPCAS